MSIKNLILKAVRNGLGLIIVFGDWLTRPKAMKRTDKEQSTVQQRFEGHSLYQLYACPFCVKTRRAIHALGINIEPKDLNKNQENRVDLEQGGGRIKVPCLRIEEEGEVRWMYDSNTIIQYLQEKAA